LGTNLITYTSDYVLVEPALRVLKLSLEGRWRLG